jgi:hypothetical protein
MVKQAKRQRILVKHVPAVSIKEELQYSRLSPSRTTVSSALEPSLLSETKTAAENMAAVIDLSGISADGYMVPVWLVLRLGGSYVYYRAPTSMAALGRRAMHAACNILLLLAGC